jgi:hypothetical protein
MTGDTDAVSVFETPLDDAQEARLDARAEAEIDGGKGVPHERVCTWLLKLAEGQLLTAPQA